MPKCRLRYDVRFSRGQINALLELLAEQFQYDDAAGVAPDRYLMSCYEKMQYRLQQNQERDNVVRQLQAQNKATSEEERLGSASLERTAHSTGVAIRHLQQRTKLGRKKRGFYA